MTEKLLSYWFHLDQRLDFDRPAWLMLFLLAPLVWLTARRSLAAMGGLRWSVAIGLRMLVLSALVLTLAEIHLVRRSDRLAVMYLLDRSLSVTPRQAKSAIEFINESRKKQRDRHRGDLAGVVVFGREAAVELPPCDDELPLGKIETPVDGGATDMAAAMRLARACFPADYAKRVVVLSDGNENIESAMAEAQALLAAGIGIDVVPLERARIGDVEVERVVLPGDVLKSTPFDVRIVLNNSHGTSDRGGTTVAGKLQVFRRAGDKEQLLSEEEVAVAPGKQVLSFRDELDVPDFYTYEARFIPAQRAEDALAQNNQATGFTQVAGSGRALLIEDSERRGEFAHLVDRLRSAHLEVDLQSSDQATLSLAELQRYDTVVLANVARTSGEGAEISQFGDEQIDALVRNTQQLGCGLVMLGGPDSFGAGGWTNTPLEQAMPVDFQIKNAKMVPSGALVLVIDRSGSMMGPKIEMSKAAAIAAVKSLGSRDQIGVIAFDSVAQWIVPVGAVGDGRKAIGRIGRLAADGGTNMMPAMSEGARALGKAQAAVKHMVVLTDGHTEGTGYPQLAAQMRRQGMTTTAVAVGSDADMGLMQRIAQQGSGKFYRVNNPKTIPRIFMKEARRIARPLIYERQQPFQPRIVFPHEMLGTVDGPLPPISGYVMTTPKDSPLVEVVATVPQPSPGGQVLLACWTYGLGRTVVLTTDAGQRWARDWTAWEGYDKVFSHLLRWSMRPKGGEGKFDITAGLQDGQIRVTVTALDEQNQFLNFLTMRGAVVAPDRSIFDLNIEQAAPGRYRAQFAAERAGNYFLTVVPASGSAALRVGVNVPHSAEFRDASSNDALLASLAGQAPHGGAPGRVLDMAAEIAPPQSSASVFRHDLAEATSRQSCWHLVLMAGICLFFCDVLNRRVSISLQDLSLAAQWAGQLVPWRQKAAAAPSVFMQRLRERKQSVAQQLDNRHVAKPFDSGPPATVTMPLEPAPAARAPGATSTQITPDSEEESYTARLLRAKRRALDK